MPPQKEEAFDLKINFAAPPKAGKSNLDQRKNENLTLQAGRRTSLSRQPEAGRWESFTRKMMNIISGIYPIFQPF